MGRRGLLSLSCALACAGGVPLAARAASAPDDEPEPEISAALDRAEVALDDTVTLSITATVVKGEAGELQLPALRDFDVVSRSSSEQMSFVFSGNTPSFRRTTVTSLALTPHRTGLLAIEPARFVWKGKAYATRQLAVRVLPAGAPAARSRQRGRADPDPPAHQQGDSDRAAEDEAFSGARVGNRDLVLRATVDNDKPFVGQQVTYALWLLSRVNVSGIDKLQLPKMDGFWTEEVEAPQQLVGESRIVDGVPVQAYLLRKRALFALRPGKASIEPAEVEVLTGMGLLFSRSSVRRATQPLSLDVQPLPAPRPPGFDVGNVGQWSLAASVEPAAVSAGQPVTLRIVLSGRGNLRDVQLPHLPAIPGLRAYDATIADKPTVEQGRAGGTRTIEQLLVPERTGEIELPALTLTTFDPQQRQYRTLRTDPLHIAVGAAAPTPSSAQGAPPGATTQNLLLAGGLRPIRLRLTQLQSGAPPWTSAWFWPALLIAPLAVGGVVGSRRALRLAARDPDKLRVRGARSAARKRLRGAEALLARVGGSGPEFYAEVARALTGYLADKQGIAASGLTREELARALAARGHTRGVTDGLVAALDECDRARFAPSARDPKAQQALLERADSLLGALDRGRKEPT